MEYSLLNRRPEEWFPLLNEHQISVIARGPLAKGILTDNNTRKIERVKEKITFLILTMNYMRRLRM